MKHFTLLLAAFALAATASAQGVRFNAAKAPAKASAKVQPAKAAEVKAFLPSHTNYYMYNIVEEDWTYTSTVTSFYDENGRVKENTEVGDDVNMRSTYTYNADGNLVEQVLQRDRGIGRGYENYARVITEYDDVCPTLMKTNTVYQWQDKDWKVAPSTQNMAYEITRDANNKLTGYTQLIFWMDEVWYYMLRNVNEYDEAGNQTLFKFQSQQGYTEDVEPQPIWQDYSAVATYEWDCNAGNCTLRTWQDLFEGDYRLKSGNVLSGGEEYAPISATYDGEDYDMQILFPKETYESESGIIEEYDAERDVYTCRHLVLDGAPAEATQTVYVIESYLDKDGDGEYEYFNGRREEQLTYDAYGTMVNYTNKVTMDNVEYELQDASRITATYNEDNLPVEYISENYNADIALWDFTQRVTYDYDNITAVGTVAEQPKHNAPTVFYDTMGRRFDASATVKGIVVRQDGKKVMK